MPIVSIQTTDDIRNYYHSSIPGLKRAEESGLVKPIHKAFSIPDRHSTLKIDRLWFSRQGVYIFYHVENMDKIAYLGGFFSGYSGYEDKKNFDQNPRDFVGTPKEKGVISNNSFYSFVKLPSMEINHINNENGDAIEHLLFNPILFIEDSEYSFKAIDIDMNAATLEEPIETFELDGQIDVDGCTINLYRLEAGVSFNRIYFTYIPKDREIIYDLEAYLFADTGESFSFESNTTIINSEKNEYYIETRPFDRMPSSFRIQFQSISFAGKDSIHGLIDTGEVKEKRGTQNLNIPLDRVMETDFILETLGFTDKGVELAFIYKGSEDEDIGLLLEAGYTFHHGQKTLLSHTNGDQLIIPNVVLIHNNFGHSLGMGDYPPPKIIQDEINSIYCIIPSDFWVNSERIYISIYNLTYKIKLSQSIEIEI